MVKAIKLLHDNFNFLVLQYNTQSNKNPSKSMELINPNTVNLIVSLSEKRTCLLEKLKSILAGK